MNERNTPGPWTVETVPTAVGICHKIMPFRACIYVDSGGDKDPDEMKANAELIATAPDMLHWLQQVALMNCTCDNWPAAAEVNPAEHDMYCHYRVMTGYVDPQPHTVIGLGQDGCC